jgi:pimeloyl-ACP methyl ester carboxylesterase
VDGGLATLDVEGIPVAYEVRGEGRPIVLVHGWSADHRYMVADLEPVFDVHPGWRRIYPDLPGHGATPAPAWLTGQDQMLSVLRGFVAAVVGDEPFALVGSSYGGHTALGLTRMLRDQVSGLCLLVPDMPRPDGSRDVEPRVVLADDGSATDLADDERWMTEALVVREAWMLDELRAHDAPAYAVADYGFLERLDAHYLATGAAGSPGRPFAGPSLVVTGRQDATTGFRGALPLLDELPRATWAVLDVAGHQLGRLERPVLLEALVVDWLDRLVSPSPRRPG